MINFSLLWPADISESKSKPVCALGNDSLRDLGLENTLEDMDVREENRENIRAILFNLCTDLKVIRYRQDVLDDLIHSPVLVACLKELMPQITALNLYEERSRTAKKWEKADLFQVVMRLNELKVYVDCIVSLGNSFQKVSDDIKSEGLKDLWDYVTALRKDALFERLERELPPLLTEVQTHASVTIGVNLNSELRPVEATLLSVNSKKFASSWLIAKLFGDTYGEAGAAGFYKLDDHGEAFIASGSEYRRVKYAQPTDPLLSSLFQDLNRILSRTSRSMNRALEQFLEVKTDLLISLRQDVIFYMAAVEMIESVRSAGLPMCRPEIVPNEERICEVRNNFNINLALNLLLGEQADRLPEVIVQNDVAFGPRGRIIILTGPNQGGKTTYMQAVGLTQVLAQAGMYVPGERARISPVDNILTHYPVEESLEKGTGRFGDEAKRLNEIFEIATQNSLMLFNESLCSTSPGESLYLAQDVVRVLLKMGARAIFVTHLHELAARLDELNSEFPSNGRAVSMVASKVVDQSSSGNSGEPIKRTYKVAFGPPMGHSCAKEIAARYNVSYEQLIEMLAKRGVLSDAHRA